MLNVLEHIATLGNGLQVPDNIHVKFSVQDKKPFDILQTSKASTNIKDNIKKNTEVLVKLANKYNLYFFAKRADRRGGVEMKMCFAIKYCTSYFGETTLSHLQNRKNN